MLYFCKLKFMMSLNKLHLIIFLFLNFFFTLFYILSFWYKNFSWVGITPLSLYISNLQAFQLFLFLVKFVAKIHAALKYIFFCKEDVFEYKFTSQTCFISLAHSSKQHHTVVFYTCPERSKQHCVIKMMRKVT